MWHGNVTPNKDFDETVTYLWDSVEWFAPVAQPIAQWKNMAYIFSFSLWMAILLSVIIYACIWITLEYNLHQSSSFQMIFLIVGISLNNSQSTCTVFRSMLALFLLYVFIITSSFQSNLISILTSPLYNEQISNIIDATNKTNYKYGYHQSLQALILSDGNTITEKIRENEVLCELNALTCANRTAYKREMVMAKGRRFMTYVMSKSYRNRDGKSLFYIFEDSLLSYPISMVMLKGHPLYDEFNRLLSWLHNGGLIQKLSDDYERLIMKSTEDSINDEDHLSLTLNHVSIPFIIVFIGLSLALVAFIIEMLGIHY